MPGDTATSDPGERPFPMPTFDAAHMIESNQRAMRAALEAQSQGLQRAAKIGTSVFEFIQRRLTHDAELAHRLGTAKAPQDAYAAYHDFLGTALEEYAAELSTLSSIYVDQTREAMHHAERQVDGIARPMAAE